MIQINRKYIDLLPHFIQFHYLLLFIAIEDDAKKQPFEDVLEIRCSEKFRNTHKKTTVLKQFD